MSPISVTNSGRPIIISPSRQELLRVQSSELIFQENSERWVLLPIEYPTLWELYKKIETTFWTPEDFSWKQEGAILKTDAKLSENAFRWLLDWSACFNLVYGIPGGNSNENTFPDILDLSCEFVESIQTPEGRAYLGFQSLFENFHREVFTRFVQTFITNDNDLRIPNLYKSNYERKTIQAKQKWLDHHMNNFHSESKKKKLAGDLDTSHIDDSSNNNSSPMAEVLIALMVYKGYFFSSLALIMLVTRNAENSSFYKASKQILIDMCLHADFAAHLYSSLENKLEINTLKSMLVQAMELEYNFILDIIGSDEDFVCSFEDIGSLLRGLIIRSLHVLGYHEESDLELPSSNLPGETNGGPLYKQLPIPPPFSPVHKGPFKIVPPEKQAQQPTTTSTTLELTEDF